MTELLAEKLKSVEWDFGDASIRNGIHNIHPYPARFIPHIPRELIRLFHPGDNSAVFDPFCGSGTTIVEAMLSGIPAVGVDLNPLAILIARVKTTPLEKPLAPAARDLVSQARAQPAPVPDIPRVDHWFLPPVQQALARLAKKIDGVEEPTLRDALKVALSRIIVRVSNQESDTRYAAVAKTVAPEQVYDLFLKSAHAVDKALTGIFGELLRPTVKCRLVNRNILEVEPDEIAQKVGLVITSPPYPNAYEYWLYHKYRMYWLGMDPIAVRSAEIGARPHYFKKNHQTEADFERQMGRCFWLLARVMRIGAVACFLVGRSVIHGREIDNVLILERAAAPHGFRIAAIASRRIRSSRKSFAHGRIEKESIMLFVLEGSL